MRDISAGADLTASGKRAKLLRGASIAVMAVLAGAQPAHAQLARMRAGAGVAPVVTTPAATVSARSPTMRDALARSLEHQTRADAIRGYVSEARAAALAAVRINPADGLSKDGLDPVRGAVQAALDATGKLTWQGAALPTQTTGADGRILVTIVQNDPRAVLTWNRFDVGSNTTLQFDQKLAGVARPDWIALNRVVDAVAPSTILGAIKADGSVFVLNQRGVIFGKTAQVNLRSLLASSLDIGNFAAPAGPGSPDRFVSTTIKDRNATFLQNGLLIDSAKPNAFAPMLTSSLTLSGEYQDTRPLEAFSPDVEGDVIVDRGASLNASAGGFVILTAPKIVNDGAITAPEGQVSLQAGRAITYVTSAGGQSAIDPDVRGVLLRSVLGSDGSVVNSGLIDVLRGFISLGAGLDGSVTNAGLLSSTTSVSRNGKISLTAGTVTLSGASDPAHAGGIVIRPDAGKETVPQGTAGDPPGFRSSKIEIGAKYTLIGTPLLDRVGVFGPARVGIGQNALILAPNADVSIGGLSSVAFDPQYAAPSRIDIASGAVIDVGGIKDLVLDASRNSLVISPLKRNELRDTPNYREVPVDGGFTLNGATVYVDPRVSGVRDDGVVWVGSPLIEAGSAASQIGVSASELMTRGGNINLAVGLAQEPTLTAPVINIAEGAVIDFTGGWVRYADGIVRTSKLLTADGRIIDISQADPNETYTAIGDGFTEVQAKFGVTRTFANPILQGGRFQAGYDEGRDAGSLIISASTATIDGTLHGNAFAGTGQTGLAQKPTVASTLTGDSRKLQGAMSQLPSGGYLKVGSFTGKSGIALGGDIIVHSGSNAVTAAFSEILLSDTMLSSAGLSMLSLQTSGGVTFTGDSDLRLANGGTLAVDAGRTIRFDGDIAAASGTISARTYELGGVVSNGGIVAGIGSAFRADDDIASIIAVGAEVPRPFDILVGGTLSTAGLWVNDFGKSGSEAVGSAWANGGSISLAVAPKVLVALGSDLQTARYAADLSGSIRIDSGALLNVSSGGYVTPDGSLELTARGGNVALINETTYASLSKTVLTDSGGQSDRPVFGNNQSVTFTPGTPAGAAISNLVVPALVPLERVAEVSFSVDSIKGFGFGGGGTFTLVSPDMVLGSGPAGDGPVIGLDFLQKTGFATLDLSAWHAKVVPNLFNNGRTGNSAFFETTRFVVARGETLDLTQTVLPSILDQATAARLTALGTGADVTAVLSPVVPVDPWDRRSATLQLGGLTELDVEQGGQITGAAGAQIIVPKLYNAGTIRIAGGLIKQQAFLPNVLVTRAMGVRDAALGGEGLAAIFGSADASGRFTESALNSADIFSDAERTQRLTNGELFTRPGLDLNVYFLGRLDANEGIRLEAGSVTDLAGTAILNPRAPILRNGERQLAGRVVAGGTIETSAAFVNIADALFSAPRYENLRYTDPGDNSIRRVPLNRVTPGRSLNALPGSMIDISGARAGFDELVTPTEFARVDQWSNAGRISLLGGGSIAGSLINAHGGAAQAEGGVLEWLSPTLRQADSNALAVNVLFADQVMAAGFDTVVARRSLLVEGPVSLSLDKAFILRSAPAPQPSLTESNLAVTVNVAPGADATISAPYVRIASLAQHASSLAAAPAGTGALTFNAKTIDLVGGISLNVPGAVNFKAAGDIRLTGVRLPGTAVQQRPSLTGQIISNGNINFTAGQVYATTGTGNLQRLIEDRRAGIAGTAEPFAIVSTNSRGTISFARAGTGIPDAPLSAGSYLQILAANIVQDGILRAPLGLLDIGSATPIGYANGTSRIGLPFATESIRFGPSSLTSVAATGLNIPYGTTTDLTEYFFLPNTNAALTTVPVGELGLGGASINIETGAKVDGRGGGDVFSYEFVPGTGGSRDVLDRFNPDIFSGNDGLQFEDGRQVYAIIPKSKADLVAKFDPIYSADYAGGGGVDLYGADAGRSVTLDAAPGIEAGEYLLLPAHYALLPGALRVVESIGAAVPTPGNATTLLDGSIVVGGRYTTAGSDFADSVRRAFTLQSSETFRKYSRIETNSGTQTVVKLAEKQGKIVPRLPLDAARVTLSPLTSLRVAGAFDFTAPGGRGAQVDIGGTNILIAKPGTTETAGVVTLTTDTLANLNANSLVIGALRTDNSDGTTTLGVTAHDLVVDSGVDFAAPELVLAVGGEGSSLTIRDGARLTAAGKLDDLRSGDYVLPSFTSPPTGYPFDATGIGAVLRLANGPERLVMRDGDAAQRNSLRQARLIIGNATLTAEALAIETSRNFTVHRDAVLNASAIALSGDVIRFGGPFIRADLEAKLAGAGRLTLRSPDAIGFASGEHGFNDLRIDAPGIARLAVFNEPAFDVIISADNVELGNAGRDLGGCIGIAIRACGDFSSTLTLNATEVTFGSGQFRTYGFDDGVTLNSVGGIFVEGVGGFSIDDPRGIALTFNTPFLIDRSNAADPRKQAVRPDYLFSTLGEFTMRGPALTVAPPSGFATPGARIAIGSTDAPLAFATIDNALIRATSGIIDIRTDAGLTLSGTTSLQTPGYTRTFGDKADSVTVSAGAGTINLVALNGNIDTAPTTSLVIDSGVGKAGSLNVLASRGELNLAALLNPGVSNGVARNSSFRFDAGLSAFDFASFVANNGLKFQGDIAIRTGLGDLSLDAGQTLRAASVSLTADDDAGSIAIAGTIDTSGEDVSKLKLSDPAYPMARVNGGDIVLYGNAGVTLAPTARLAAFTSGYGAEDTRQASGGDVTIGIGHDTAAIILAEGAVIDVAARRPGNRLVGEVVKDPATLNDTTVTRLAQSDIGGTVSFRAPIATGNTVDIRNDGTLIGASALSIEAFRRYDLQSISSGGFFSGVSVTGSGDAFLNAGTTGKPNFLADATTPGTLAHFIRNFAVTAENGDSLSGYRLRPGVELNGPGDIILASNWNLGAGTITDFEGAVAAGLMRRSPLGTDAAPRYEVVAGKEAELFERFVDLTYRVGGKANGEAAVVTLRAAGDLKIENSITDGFFVFHDSTDADYMSYQLGGGNRKFQPAVNFTCGVDTSNCTDAVSYTDVRSGAATANFGNSVRVSLLTAQRGDDSRPFIHAPYSASANAAAADGTGDPLGVAELFPLLSDGSAPHSSSFRLIAGASGASTNPLQIDASSRGSVFVSGEKTYTVEATPGTAGYGGGLQLIYRPPFLPGDPQPPVIANVTDFLNAQFGDDGAQSGDLYTTLNWGGGTTGMSRDARAAALAFFAGRTFTGPAGARSGVIAPLSEVIAFLSETAFGKTYAEAIAAGLPGYNAVKPAAVVGNYGQGKAYVGTIVRTGDGNIDVAAAHNIDLRKTPFVINRNEAGISRPAGTESAQVGGNALYTAGTRVSRTDVPAGQLPDFGGERLDYIPGLKGLLNAAPVLAWNGGDVSLAAGAGIFGRRDVWSESYLGDGSSIAGPFAVARGIGGSTFDPNRIGASDQRWRVGRIGLDERGRDTQIAIVPQLFSSGVGTLAGGDVSIRAGNDVSDLTVALDNSVVTSTVDGVKTLAAFGSGNLALAAGADLLGGHIDIASGSGTVAVGRNVGAAGTTLTTGSFATSTSDKRNLLRVRVSDATFSLAANGAVNVGGIGALGAAAAAAGLIAPNSAGFFSSIATASITANEAVTLVGNRLDQLLQFNDAGGSTIEGYVLPPSLALTSLASDVVFADSDPRLLYPSRFGQLSLLAAGNIQSFALAMSDADPSDLPGAYFVGIQQGLGFGFPGVFPTTRDGRLRRYHNRRITHAGDDNPARIFAGGSIRDAVVSLPKQARIIAGEDIVNLYFEGQNVAASDTTRIVAGRDITATASILPQTELSFVVGNNIILGGPGALFVEAGRDLGPFISSATVGDTSYGGGIRTIGNDANPWLGADGAKLYALFGVAGGADYAALRETYVNPANAARLDGDLFAQNADINGNQSPDRARPLYAPVLATWLRDNEPAAFAAVFGADPPASAADLTTQAYARYADLYAAFAALGELRQRRFLLDKVYFGELQAPADPNGNSSQQFIRGYRAVQTLFPANAGYTDNLATYETDPTTVNADHPLGVPTKKLLNGQPVVAARVNTGNADLRLATIQTARGGDVTIIGPGGDFIAGSVVRTEAQIARRATRFGVSARQAIENGNFAANTASPIAAIPLGFEGVLSLRGGGIRTFTDGDFRLNQSRLFTLKGGDIIMWSSNGDLNAGQGPKSASNFPPVTLRFTPDGFSEVDSAGSVAGAGIAAFRPSPDVLPASVTLIAPVGTVDAGDAGVRASGDVFVAAARVANADNFKAGGQTFGVPSLGVTAAPALPANAAAAVAANVFRAGNAADALGDGLSRIVVDVLGYFGSGDDGCPEGQTRSQDNGQCEPDVSAQPARGMQ